jgi:prevent-host-death family protein
MERVIQATEFKARCLALIDRVAIDHVPVIITKRGRPVARLVAVDEVPASRETMGSVRLAAEDDADYFSTGDVWDTER